MAKLPPLPPPPDAFQIAAAEVRAWEQTEEAADPKYARPPSGVLLRDESIQDLRASIKATGIVLVRLNESVRELTRAIREELVPNLALIAPK